MGDGRARHGLEVLGGVPGGPLPTTDDAGEKSGGPQYYLQRGIKGGLGKGLALFFSVAALLACFGIGNMTQGNSIAVNVDSSFGIPTWITGAVLAVMTMVVLVGGIKSIGKVTAGFVPVMIVFYVLGALWILFVNASAIPSAFATIFTEAFTGSVLITTGTWTEGKAAAATMTSDAFATGLPGNWGHWIVTIGLVMFAYSTILGWSYYGERQVERLVGTRLIMPFRVLFSLVVFFGCTTELDLAWTFSDVMNGLMAIPNLLGLLILSGLIARETRLYLTHDPKLVATEAQIRDFVTEDPGYREWLAQEKQLDRAHAEHLHPHATGGSSVR